LGKNDFILWATKIPESGKTIQVFLQLTPGLPAASADRLPVGIGYNLNLRIFLRPRLHGIKSWKKCWRKEISASTTQNKKAAPYCLKSGFLLPICHLQVWNQMEKYSTKNNPKPIERENSRK
jgi:hypothetical protein